MILVFIKNFLKAISFSTSNASLICLSIQWRIQLESQPWSHQPPSISLLIKCLSTSIFKMLIPCSRLEDAQMTFLQWSSSGRWGVVPNMTPINGTPVNRIPIMAKQVLDLYMLYKLVTEKGGLVEVINKKIWREITKGLNLPTSITSAAFTLRTQYMKYLYPYECEKQSLSSPAELQAAIDSNRREGRRPSYSSALFGYSPSTAPGLLSPPRVHLPSMNVSSSNGIHLSPGQVIKKEDGLASCALGPSHLHIPFSLGGHHSVGLPITLEQLREKLESGEPPDKRVARFSEDQQRLMQHALQHNLFAMATHMPMSIKINGKDDRQELALNLSTNGISSINMSIEINGTLYTGVLFAQRPTVHVIAGPSSCTSASQSTTSPTSVKGPASAEPSTSGSP
ncbi:AT-rich interactive domain-containing protein 3B-like [Rhinoraja longicauda]